MKDKLELIDKLIFILSILTAIFAIFMMVFGIFGCEDSCDVGEMSCDGPILKICSSEKRWMTVQDCSDIWSFDMVEQWVCCETVDGGPECDRSCE